MAGPRSPPNRLASPRGSSSTSRTPAGWWRSPSASSCDLGVDVETVARESAVHDLAGRYFAPSEAAYARAGEGPELVERFFAFWTLKEAYIKARGMGLALPLDGFAYDIAGKGPPTISFTETCPDDPERWRFLRRPIGTNHRLALAVSAPQADISVCFVRTVPLLE